MAKDKCVKFKWMVNYQRECRWLEEMAGQGWILENITLGVFYTFRKSDPVRMMYEIDRFNLPKKPTLEEIRHKELFMEMASELGWREVTHDESLTYYFCKEYEEGGINELYNDEQSRMYRARKFGNFMKQQVKRLAFWGMVVALVDLLMMVVPGLREYKGDAFEWYNWFTIVYVIIANGMAVMLWRRAVENERDLAMTRSEWEQSVDPKTHKTVHKLILTIRGLNRMLKREEAKGWILKSVTPTKYYFEKSEGGQQIYTMDSKWLVNKRREAAHQDKFEDGKDWNGLNNDWQFQSVEDAEAKGWTFVCALENRSIIYRGQVDKVQPLNEAKYDNSLRGISLIGEYGLTLVICGLIGGIIGFCMGFFMG